MHEKLTFFEFYFLKINSYDLSNNSKIKVFQNSKSEFLDSAYYTRIKKKLKKN